MDDRFRSDFEKHRELSKRITFARTQISLPVANVRFSAEVSLSASGPDRRPSGVRARPVRLTSATLESGSHSPAQAGPPRACSDQWPRLDAVPGQVRCRCQKGQGHVPRCWLGPQPCPCAGRRHPHAQPLFSQQTVRPGWPGVRRGRASLTEP